MKLSDYGLNAYLNNMKQNSPNNMESQNKNNNSLIDIIHNTTSYIIVFSLKAFLLKNNKAYA